jgi:hypothetical protein
MNSLAGHDGQKSVQFEYLNPKAANITELYDLFDSVNSGWSNGIPSIRIREYSLSDQSI